MALTILGKTKCSICESVIEGNVDIVATTHFITEQDNPLWRFSDSSMHSHCFFNWEYKTEFISEFNNTRGKIIWGNGTYHFMENDGSISVSKKD